MTVFEAEPVPVENKLVAALIDALDADDLVAIVECCKQMCRRYADPNWVQGDASHWLVALDSEADCFPTGPERKHWNKEALSKLDTELAEMWPEVPGKARALLPEFIELVAVARW
ncbi:MAG: hypothetical protein COB37_10765 [Kordiimonadales bacterium]|nr:MAG: hypothetical protein COB37_10765 [Kordiimonadales bacterium]